MEKLGIIERMKLLSAFGAGNYLYTQYISESDPLGSYQKMMSDRQFDDDQYAKALRRLSDGQFIGILDTCRRYGISLVTPDDDSFPQALKNIDEPPILLFVLGDISLLKERPAAAVVGCRRPSDYSVRVTNYFAGELAKRGAAIISGFANGVDTAAHTAAMYAGSVTAAVLGCGLLYDYPKGKQSLKADIARHGAVISEYFPTQQPQSAYFKVRNRLIAGLSDCVIVTEASSHSGALNTASHALDQGKDIFVCPPHDIFMEQFAGQTELLADGALLALDPEEIYDHIVEERELYCL